MRSGAPWGIRTLDILIRSQSLYPAEVRAHVLAEKRQRQFLQCLEMMSMFLYTSAPEKRREAGKKHGQANRIDLGVGTGLGFCVVFMLVYFGFLRFKRVMGVVFQKDMPAPKRDAQADEAQNQKRQRDIQTDFVSVDESVDACQRAYRSQYYEKYRKDLDEYFFGAV